MELVGFFGGTVVLNAALAALFGYLIKNRLAKDLAEHEAKLRVETQEKVAAFNAELEHLRVDFQIRHSTLHPKRMEVVEELYKRLVAAELATGDLMASFRRVGAPTEEEMRKKAGDAVDHLFLYFNDHKIYFDEATVNQIQACHASMFDPLLTHSSYMQFPVLDHAGVSNRAEALRKASESFHQETPAARRALEASFRALLGVNREGV